MDSTTVLKRKVYDKLLQWKKNKHDALTIEGLRQVGKTFIVRKFGEDNYGTVLYVNFAEDPTVKTLFVNNLEVDGIVGAIGMYCKKSPVPNDTLIIFDEIQECNRARTSLKKIAIDGRYDVIATGSLLGISYINKKKDNPPSLLPMGYETTITMHSLDFEEFLWANGIPEKEIEHVKNCVREKIEIPPVHHAMLQELFRDYMIVGGMPKAVSTFLEGKNYNGASECLDDILSKAKMDINKYNDDDDAMKTSDCFDSIPEQLGDSNKKFTYSRLNGKSWMRSQNYEGNLLWIRNAGYGNFCYGLKQISKPLKMQKIRDSFKVYMTDTGMLVSMMGRGAMLAIYQNDHSYNMGAVAENVVAENIMKCGLEPTYYRKRNGNNQMEIDFVLEMGNELFAIEVKSGKDRDSPSISKVNEVFKVERRIMFEKSNIYIDKKGIEHYPLYASAFIDQLETPTGLPF